MTEIALSSEPAASSSSFLQTIDRVLYPITLGYTAVIFVLQIFEFLKSGEYRPRYELGDVYLALLTAYAAQREGAKWLGANEALMRIRRGEIFIGLWFALYLTLAVSANVTGQWVLPVEIKSITLGVLGIFAATGVSSAIRTSRRNTNDAAKQRENTSERRHAVVEFLRTQGPASSKAVATALGIPPTSSFRILEALVAAGRVRQIESPDTRERLYTIG